MYGKPRPLRKDVEIAAYCRVHLQIAVQQFEQLICTMKSNKGKVSNTVLRTYSETVRDYLFDLQPIVEFLERKKDGKYEFFRGRKSYGVMSWELFRVSRQLAIQSSFRNKPLHIDHKTAQIVSIFVLRQALEAKFERIVAVILYDKNAQTPRLRHGFHYDFVADNPNYFEFTSVDFLLLRKIYEWCNTIVHRAYQPFAWQVSHAQSICAGLWAHGPMTARGGSSIHGGIRILDVDGMQTTFVKHFINSYEHGIWCVNFGAPEAVTGYYD